MPETPVNQPRVLIVTSFKGGIGKSTVTANLADALCRRGSRVLCVDCDWSNRSLDLLFGRENPDGMGIAELVSEKAEPRDVIEDVGGRGLFFIPGPTEPFLFEAEAFRRKVLEAAGLFGCDTVIVDTPGASDRLLPVVASADVTAVVVASHLPTSVRGAERTGEVLASLGVRDPLLIINRFDAAGVLRRERMGISELIDGTGLRLLGVIPDSPLLELGQENGVLVSAIRKDRSGCAAAFDEIAARLCGERLPVLSFVPGRRRRKLIDPQRKKFRDSGEDS